jgi:hypothetical protein
MPRVYFVKTVAVETFRAAAARRIIPGNSLDAELFYRNAGTHFVSLPMCTVNSYGYSIGSIHNRD